MTDDKEKDVSARNAQDPRAEAEGLSEDQMAELAWEVAVLKKRKARRRLAAAAAAAILLIAGYLAITRIILPERKYQSALALIQEEKYGEAAAILTGIPGYKDTDSLLASNDALAREAKRQSFQTVGNTVLFGAYPQTEAGDDSTPIEWIVLDTQEEKSLLISKYGLDAQQYHTDRNDITWETCSLRAWLNGEFLQKAFSEEEQKQILTTTVDNSREQACRGGLKQDQNTTQDKIFLLSYAETARYFGDPSSDSDRARIMPTPYAIKNGAFSYNNYKTAGGYLAGYWWLRTPGAVRTFPSLIFPDGSLYHNYDNVVTLVVRPVFWIDLSAESI